MIKPSREASEKTRRVDSFLLPPSPELLSSTHLRILLDHRGSNSQERFIGREESSTSGERVSLQESLKGVLREHLDDPSSVVSLIRKRGIKMIQLVRLLVELKKG